MLKSKWMLGTLIFLFLVLSCTNKSELDAVKRRNAQLLAKVYSYSDQIRELEKAIRTLKTERPENYCNIYSHLSSFSDELTNDTFLVYPSQDNFGGINQHPIGFISLEGYAEIHLTDYSDGDYSWQENVEYFVVTGGDTTIERFYKDRFSNIYNEKFSGKVVFPLSRKYLPEDDNVKIDNSSQESPIRALCYFSEVYLGHWRPTSRGYFCIIDVR